MHLHLDLGIKTFLILLYILDSLGSNIVVHSYGSTIVKITPGINYDLNLNWISDKARYMFDGLYKQRILKPLYVNKLNQFVTLTLV